MEGEPEADAQPRASVRLRRAPSTRKTASNGFAIGSSGWIPLFRRRRPPPEGRDPIHLYNAEKDRFWPRVGLAYRPTDRWVVRMGGVYNNANQMNNLTVFSDTERRASNILSGMRRNYITFSNPFPSSESRLSRLSMSCTFHRIASMLYNAQWSASVQASAFRVATVFEVAYSGHQGVRTWTTAAI
jgi:hypothetical protein